MGVFAKSLKAAIGYPAPGWAPPYGYSGDSIATAVNANTAMGVSAFTAGIRLIAEDLASLPLITYERLAKGKDRALDHPAYGLLHDVANPEMTAMVFRETGIAHMYSWGNWYAEKELNGVGATARLWPLRPDRMTVAIEGGKRVYKYRLPDGSGVVIPAARMFHVPGWGFDGLVGYSRVTLMRRALESAIVTSEYGLRTLANDARPGVTIKHPNQLSGPAKRNIAESWDEAHQGLSNAQRTAVLDEGMEIEETGFSPEDAQYLSSRKFSGIEIAQGLRLPPHKLSDLENAHFTNIEESNIDYVVGTLGPPAKRIEQQIGKDIIGDPRYFAEHLFDGLLRGKFKERVEAEVALRLNGLATDDELREIENRNPLTDEEKRGLLVPLNSVPASAYDESGMTTAQRANVAGILARAGYDPEATLRLLNLPAIPHTGFLPVTVQPEATDGKSDDAPPETKAPEMHLHIDAGAFVNHIQTPPVTIEKGAVQVDHKAGDVHVPAPIVNVAVPKAKAQTVTKTITRPDGSLLGTVTEATDGE